MRQRLSASSCTQGTPAGLPPGMPGMALVIDGAMQQAPQPERHDGSAMSADRDEMASDGGIAGLSSRVARRRQPA